MYNISTAYLTMLSQIPSEAVTCDSMVKDVEFSFNIRNLPFFLFWQEIALKCGIGTSWEEICASREIERTILLSIQQIGSEGNCSDVINI